MRRRTAAVAPHVDAGDRLTRPSAAVARRGCATLAAMILDDAPDLHPTTWRMLRALRAGVRISRNRHYALFQDAHVRRAVELHRFLRSIARDVERNADALSIEVLPPDAPDRGGYVVRLEVRRLHGSRTAYLTAIELALLAEDTPQIAALLAGGGARAAEGEGEGGRR